MVSSPEGTLKGRKLVAEWPQLLFILSFLHFPSDCSSLLSLILVDHGGLPGSGIQVPFLEVPDPLFSVGFLGVSIYSYYGGEGAKRHPRGSLGST